MKFILEVTSDFWKGSDEGLPPVKGAKLVQLGVDQYLWCIDIGSLDALAKLITSLTSEHPTIDGCRREVVISDASKTGMMNVRDRDGKPVESVYMDILKDFPAKYVLEIYNDYRE